MSKADEVATDHHLQKLVNEWRSGLDGLDYLQSIPGSASPTRSEGYVSREMRPSFVYWVLRLLNEADTLDDGTVVRESEWTHDPDSTETQVANPGTSDAVQLDRG